MTATPEYIQRQGFIAEVIRTNRIKSASIKVDDGAVSVVVPCELSQDRITQLLHDKNRWIKDKLILHREAMPVGPKQFVSGESFSYLGRNYRLKVKRGAFTPVKLVQGRLVATLPDGAKNPNMVRNALVRWYRHHAELKLQEKVKRYAKIVDIEPASVGIKTFKSRWGSCNAKGRVEFNWRIMMAPNRIVDYVVVHELCHLKRHDHSPQFWKLVERVIPDYLERKQWLKQYGDKFFNQE